MISLLLSLLLLTLFAAWEVHLEHVHSRPGGAYWAKERAFLAGGGGGNTFTNLGDHQAKGTLGTDTEMKKGKAPRARPLRPPPRRPPRRLRPRSRPCASPACLCGSTPSAYVLANNALTRSSRIHRIFVSPRVQRALAPEPVHVREGKGGRGVCDCAAAVRGVYALLPSLHRLLARAHGHAAHAHVRHGALLQRRRGTHRRAHQDELDACRLYIGLVFFFLRGKFHKSKKWKVARSQNYPNRGSGILDQVARTRIGPMEGAEISAPSFGSSSSQIDSGKA
ncbi:hypothetical protein C8R44DRAFT_334505 [Mycena epipterygia]|nr:hypothetical protein C8R44DRAFT_334505 [Mycena epipterygia]